MSSNTPRLDKLERNLLINGNFDHWQRGTSGVASTSYLADRWRLGGGVPGSMVGTMGRSTDVPTFAESGFQSAYSFDVTATTGSGAINSSTNYVFLHRMEGFDYAEIHGRPVRIQFWVKAAKTGIMGVAVRNGASTRSYTTSVTINAANTWERKVIDLTMDSAGTWTFDETLGLQVGVCVVSGSGSQTANLNQWQTGAFSSPTTQTNFLSANGDYVRFAQMSLFSGSFDSANTIPFNRGRSVSEEYIACLRHYQKIGGNGAIRYAQVEQTVNLIYFSVPFLVPMRTAPVSSDIAISISFLANLSGQTQSGFTYSPYSTAQTNHGFLLEAAKTAHGLTGGSSLVPTSIQISVDL
jgi:hypothetical protein